MILAGDIGGTKSLFVLVAPDGAVVRERRFESARQTSVEAMVEEFLDGESAERACLAVAGPVRGRTARITNLGWTLDASCWSGMPTRLINDGAAIARAIPTLGAPDVVELHAGDPEAGGPCALVAPGTGLGMAMWTPAGALASEGGHAAFAPTGERQTALLTWWQARVERVTREHACSGRTLPDLYAFVRERDGLQQDPDVARAADPTRAIVEGQTPVCRAAVDLFLDVLGGIAGDWGLEVAASGGIYLAGGMAVALLGRMRAPAFPGG